MTQIQPDVFDLVVVGTGLEEGLIAAAAAKCGKTVLHLDQAGHYGSAWASMTLDQFVSWTQQQSELPETLHSKQPQSDPTGAAVTEQLLHVSVPDNHQSVCCNMQLHQQAVDLGLSREFSLDLTGKVVFCASEAINTMLAFGVQNYLEFKLFQGSYVYTKNKLTSVPASRAAVFKDRTLSPMDKHVLTRFLMQLGSSTQGNPFPQVPPSDPLVSLLNAQGLSPLMREYILYAVALADSDQESLVASQNKRGTPAASDRHQPAATQNATSPAAATAAAPSSPQSASQEASAAAAEPRMTNSTAVEGSLPVVLEAARPTAAAQPSAVSSPPWLSSQPASMSRANHAAASLSAHSQCDIGMSTAEGGRLHGEVLSVEEGLKALRQYLSSIGRYGTSSGAFLTPMYGCAELPQAFCRVAAVHGAVYVLRQPIQSLLLDPESRQCTGIQTDTGQVVRCSALAASASLLQNVPPSCSPAADSQQPAKQQSLGQNVSRAVCVLDGPIQEGEPQLLITIPPNTSPFQNPHAIRVIQLGSPAVVCPANRYLLYMTTLSTATASDDLSQALSALVDTTNLLPDTTTSAGSVQSNPAAAVAQSSTNGQPQALLAAFYNQQCQQECDQTHQMPPNTVCCLPPDASLDVDSAFKHAKAAFAKLYPDAAGAFEPLAASNDDDESDDEALDALGDVLQGLSTA